MQSERSLKMHVLLPDNIRRKSEKKLYIKYKQVKLNNFPQPALLSKAQSQEILVSEAEIKKNQVIKKLNLPSETQEPQLTNALTR